MAQTAFRQRYVIPWSTQDANFSGVRNQGYFCNDVAPIEALLPASASEGDVFAVYNLDGGFIVTQAAGQQIRVKNVLTTVGVTGQVESTAVGDALYLVYQASDDLWCALEIAGTLNVT